MKLSPCQNLQKSRNILPLIFLIYFCLYFGQCNNFMDPFWNFLTYCLKMSTETNKHTNYLNDILKMKNTIFWLHCDFLWAASWRKPKIYGCRSCKRWRKHDCTRVPTICTVFLAILVFNIKIIICKLVNIENWLVQKKSNNP